MRNFGLVYLPLPCAQVLLKICTDEVDQRRVDDLLASSVKHIDFVSLVTVEQTNSNHIGPPPSQTQRSEPQPAQQKEFPRILQVWLGAGYRYQPVPLYSILCMWSWFCEGFDQILMNPKLQTPPTLQWR